MFHTKFLFEAVETDLLHTQLREGERRKSNRAANACLHQVWYVPGNKVSAETMHIIYLLYFVSTVSGVRGTGKRNEPGYKAQRK